jgi:crotonobetainyl-CoA:carnitine CoA-transferase CaiB-like acyl-CoA transferase
MHVGVSYGDPTAGLHGALAVLAALLHRRRTGEGQFIDVSLWEAAATLLPDALLEYDMNAIEPPRIGNRHPSFVPHGVFRSAGDDRWVSIAVTTEDEWRSLCHAIERPALAEDPRCQSALDRKAIEDEIEREIIAWTSSRSAKDATDHLQRAGVAAFPTMTNQDLDEDPHLGSRGFFVELPHPEVGTRRHAGIPWKLSRTPCAVEMPAPCLGQHNDDVLRRVLGYSDSEIADLTAAGALG